MTPEPARAVPSSAVPSLGEPFNVCDYLLDRHIRAGRGDRLALTGIAGDVSYAELAERVGHAACGLRGLGLQAEQRVVMVMADSPEFVIVYLAAMRIGAVPVPVSTMLRAGGIAEIVADSRARIVAVSAQYLDLVAGALGYPGTGEVMAVYLPVQPVGAGQARNDRGGRARLRTTRARRGRTRGPSGHAGNPVRPGRFGRDRVLVALRRLAPGVPGGVAAHRRHLRRGRRRVLRLPGPDRRHAQGQRHLGRAGRACKRSKSAHRLATRCRCDRLGPVSAAGGT